MKTLILLLLLAVLNTCVEKDEQIVLKKTIIYENVLAMVKKSRYASGRRYAVRKTTVITNYAYKYGLDTMLFARLGQAESSFRSHKTNAYTSCVGMYQISPKWWAFLAWHVQGGKYSKHLNHHKGTNIMTVLKYIGVNVEIGAIVLSTYLKQYSGDYEKALLKFSGFNVKRYRNSPVKDRYLRNVIGD